MNFRIETPVGQDVETVFTQFNGDLLTKLNPPFPFVTMERYDGEQVGDIVRMQLNFILFKQHWTSKITENFRSKTRCFFVDEGIELPFFLSSWRHRHVVETQNKQTVIVDDITFSTPFLLTDYLMYPLLYLQFFYRKPIYRRMFE